jgi:hypothetical protein
MEAYRDRLLAMVYTEERTVSKGILKLNSRMVALWASSK